LLGSDGTYTASTTAPAVDTVPGNPPPVTVVAPDGTAYSCSAFGLVYQGWTTSFSAGCTIEDRNGNSITSQPTISATTTPESVPWQNFTFNSKASPSNLPQANCFGISSPGSGQLNVYQSVNLGSSSNPLKYTFQYDAVYGLVSQITYPNGGYVKYSWGLNPLSEAVQTFDNQNLPCAFEYDTPAITNRYVSFDGVNIALEQDFHYTPTTFDTSATSSAVWTAKQTTVVTKDCARNNFNCSGAPSFSTTYNYVSAGGQTGQETAVESSVRYGAFNGTMLRTVTKGWFGERLMCELETLDNGLISGKFYAYGSGDQITDKKEYDYGLITSTGTCFTGGSGPTPPSGITPTRETIVNYQSFPPTLIFPAGNSIFDRPSSVSTYGAGARVAETDYGYDESSLVAVSPAPAGHDSRYSGSYNNRGNATSVKNQCFNGSCPGGNPTTKYTFDVTGQVSTKIDPCGNATCSDMSGSAHTTTYSYLDNYASCSGAAPPSSTNAYLTNITDPLGHTKSFCYGYDDGQLRGSTDENGQTTFYTYNTPPQGCSFPVDGLDRLSTITYPDGGKTGYCYNDAAYNSSTPSPNVTTTKAVNSSANLITLTAFDGLGHTVRTVLTSDPDCASGDRTDTTYDGLGRVYSVSNPYCTQGEPTSGLTTYNYDALGRTTQVNHPDGTNILTAYTGPATQVQDEGNGTQRVTRISQTDGLGRLVSVCEVATGPFVGSGGASSPSLVGSGGTPAACGQAIAGTGFLTTYQQYDALNNLLQVNQNGLAARAYAYDSLSRLTSAANPESGTITYAYDANGNLSTKTAPAPNQINPAVKVSTTYSYDALNRLTSKSYSDGTTPTVSFLYDIPPAGFGPYTNIVGRLVQSSVNAGCLTTLHEYDAMGRVSMRWVHGCTPWHPFPYTYDLAGNMTSEGNGNFGTYNYSYNSAGRLLSFAGLISGMHYNAFGGLTSATLGDGETESYTYTKRLWLQSASVVLSSTPKYSFSLGFDPNGDISTSSDSVNGNWTYTYDPFNRLVGANQNSGAAVYNYVYDRLGNRWQQNGPHTMSATFSGSNNRIDGFSYDAAGNLLNDGSHGYTYDAENRIVKVDAGSTAVYTYDAEGRRAIVTNSSTTNTASSPQGTTQFLFDLSGRIISQQVANGDTFSRGEAYAGSRHLATLYQGDWFFSHSDWLGTERARTWIKSSSWLETCTSLPFGDWLTCVNGIDVSGLHFTGKEHDSESGLDNFGARYDSSQLGRFMSPDPSNAGAVNSDPQSWNAYAYSGSNPVRFADPDGLDYHVCIDNGNGGQNCSTVGNDAVFLGEVKNSPGVSLQGGKVFAGGVQIGTYEHFVGPGNEGTIEDTILTPSVFFAGVGAVQGAFRTGAALVGDLFGVGGGTAADTLTGLYGTVTREALEAAANSGGPTVRVVTNLTQAPAAGRAISVATGEGAGTLANAAREGGTTYVANIPKALIDQMKNAGLVEGSTTSMGGAVAQELKFAPQAAEFVVKFFRAVH
jgi:RHS repeat-associated protein